MALLYPSFLYALAAVSVPVILHLIQLRRAKRIEFSNVKFIQASKDLTASQKNLKEILILICRIFFIAFLVLAFAQPFLPASESAVPSSAAQVGIAVDNSYSMQNVHDEQDLSMLTTATDRSKTVLSLFPSTTSYSLYLNNRLNASRTLGTAEAASTIDEVDFSSKPALALNQRTNADHVFLFSDFQRSTFSPNVLSQFDSTKQLHLIPIKAGSYENILIDSVYLEDEFIRPGVENTLHVRLFNAGTSVREGTAVKLFIDNNQIAALSLDLPAQQSTEAVLNFNFSGTGSRMAYIQVEDYPVEFDNNYHFTLAPSTTVKLTEIGDNSTSPLQRLYNNEAFFNLTRYGTGNVNYGEAGTSNVLLLNGIANVSAALASTVQNYVRAGGTVVIIPAANADRNSYANLFQGLSIQASYAGEGNATKTALAAPDPANPFFRNIFSNFDAKMQMPAAARTVVWSRASEDILKFRGGAPFLSRFDRGGGYVYLMASPFDERLNELPSHALFVPIMYRLAIASYKQEQQLAYTLAGGTISVPATKSTRREGIYKLVQDSLEYIPDQQVRGGKLYFDVPADMDEAGFYDLRLNDSTLTTLAFNYNKQESLLAQYAPDELRNLLPQNRQNIHVYEYGDAFSVKGEFEKRFFGVKLWKYCLILCLFFLLAEIALIRFL